MAPVLVMPPLGAQQRPNRVVERDRFAAARGVVRVGGLDVGGTDTNRTADFDPKSMKN